MKFKINQTVYIMHLKVYGHIEHIISGGYRVTIADDNELPLSNQTISFREEQLTDGS